MAFLGRGSYRVFAQTRGGGSTLGELAWTSLHFERRLDQISGSQVTVGAGSAPWLGEVSPWSHEIAIWRDPSASTDADWVGPVTGEPSFEPDVDTFPASDLFAWFDVRSLDRHDRVFNNVDVGSIFAQLVEDALERDDSPNISLGTSLTGVPATRRYLASQNQRASDALSELSRTGLDFSAIGRVIRCGGLEVPSPPSFTLTDDTLLSPKVSPNGSEAASEVEVIGANSGFGGQPVVGRVGGPSTTLGLVQRTFNESDILDEASATSAAATRWQFMHEAPLYVSGVLSPNAPVDFDDLVPGVRVAVKLGSLDRVVDGDFRLLQVDVNEGLSDQGLVDGVAVTLGPVGTVTGG